MNRPKRAVTSLTLTTSTSSSTSADNEEQLALAIIDHDEYHGHVDPQEVPNDVSARAYLNFENLQNTEWYQWRRNEPHVSLPDLENLLRQYEQRIQMECERWTHIPDGTYLAGLRTNMKRIRSSYVSGSSHRWFDSKSALYL